MPVPFPEPASRNTVSHLGCVRECWVNRQVPDPSLVETGLWVSCKQVCNIVSNTESLRLRGGMLGEPTKAGALIRV